MTNRVEVISRGDKCPRCGKNEVTVKKIGSKTIRDCGNCPYYSTS